MHRNTSNYLEVWNENNVYDLVHFHEECQLTYITVDNNSISSGSHTFRSKAA